MKTIPSVLLLSATIAVAGWWWVGHRPADVTRAGDQASETARLVGGQASDVGIVARIKGKYFFEKQLSALAITVDCCAGRVILSGSVESPDLILRAIRIAQETGGVREVQSKLVVKS